MSQTRLFVPVHDIACDACVRAVTDALRALPGVVAVTPRAGDVFELTLDRPLAPKAVARAVEEAGYTTSASEIADRPLRQGRRSVPLMFPVAAGLIVVYLGVTALIGFDPLSIAPVVDGSAALGTLFVLGVLTSVHCMGMCGPLNLAALSLGSTRGKSGGAIVLFHSGRLVGYGATGALAGAVGSVFQLSGSIGGAIVALSGCAMIVLALSFGGALPRRVRLPHLSVKIPPSAGPFLLGAANALMPCGPLQAIQLYALSTESALAGAVSMVVFCAGTIPLLAAVALVGTRLGQRARQLMTQIGSALMLVLALAMIARGAGMAGFSLPSVAAPAPTTTSTAADAPASAERTYDGYLIATREGDCQEVAFDLSYNGYADVVVEEGVPVRMVIHADASPLTGCNDSVILPTWGIEKRLQVGDNLIEFTPTTAGSYTYGCWMGMLVNRIEVVEELPGS